MEKKIYFIGGSIVILGVAYFVLNTPKGKSVIQNIMPDFISNKLDNDATKNGLPYSIDVNKLVKNSDGYYVYNSIPFSKGTNGYSFMKYDVLSHRNFIFSYNIDGTFNNVRVVDVAV